MYNGNFFATDDKHILSINQLLMKSVGYFLLMFITLEDFHIKISSTEKKKIYRNNLDSLPLF